MHRKIRIEEDDARKGATLDQVVDTVKYMLPKGAELVTARAYMTDVDFGYDRWKADEYSMGRGTHDAIIIIFPKGEPIPPIP